MKLKEAPSEEDENRSRFQALVAERPRLLTLTDGYHVRNQDEVRDIRDVFRSYPEKIYTGLVGGRQAGKLYYTFNQLAERFALLASKDVVRSMYETLPGKIEQIHADQALVFDRPSKDPLSPLASSFFYDIDLVVVTGESGVKSKWDVKRGPRTGTQIDVFSASMGCILSDKEVANGFDYRVIFANSSNLIFAHK